MRFLVFALFLNFFAAGQVLRDPFYLDEEFELMAIFEDCALINNQWGCQGDTINGMKIKKVKDNLVILVGESGTISLKFGGGTKALK